MTLGRFAENSAQCALTGGVDTTVYEDDLVALKMQDKYRFFWTSADDFRQAALVTFDGSSVKVFSSPKFSLYDIHNVCMYIRSIQGL